MHGPCATTQMGLVDGEFIVNPNQEQWDNGDLRLTVASTREKVIMIEAGANELPEDKMIEAIYKCSRSQPDDHCSLLIRSLLRSAKPET